MLWKQTIAMTMLNAAILLETLPALVSRGTRVMESLVQVIMFETGIKNLETTVLQFTLTPIFFFVGAQISTSARNRALCAAQTLTV